jgi:hypothetical protein
MVLNKAAWDAAIVNIGVRLRAREALEASFAALIAQGTGQALAVIQANVGPQLAATQATVNGLNAQIAAAQDQLAALFNGTQGVTPAERTALDRAMAWQTMSNANLTVDATHGLVITTAAFTAPRTLTLPLASAVPIWPALRITDLVGAISATNTLTIATAGSDTINGASSVTFSTAFSELSLSSNGTSKWGFDIQGIARGGTGATTAKAALANLSFGRARRHFRSA